MSDEIVLENPATSLPPPSRDYSAEAIIRHMIRDGYQCLCPYALAVLPRLIDNLRKAGYNKTLSFIRLDGRTNVDVGFLIQGETERVFSSL